MRALILVVLCVPRLNLDRPVVQLRSDAVGLCFETMILG